MKKALGVLVLAALVCSLSSAAFARKAKVIEKTFDGIESLRVKTVLGGCVIKQGSGDKISIRVEYTYDDDDFEATFRERGDVLQVGEDFDGDNAHGESEWIISVPADIDIKFESATGGLKASGLKGRIRASSGTGSITVSGFKGDLEAHSGTGGIAVSDSEGEFDLSSGTGDVTIDDAGGSFEASSGTGNVEITRAKGDFDANSGTGHVEASGLTLIDFGEFTSGTGSASVDLPAGEEYELEISSGTGSATLDCGGADLDAYVEMSAKKRSGRISSAYKFEDEEEYYRNDDKYVRKWFTDGSGGRKIEIRTGTGSAKLKK
jgi:DUF4097 and DUF4098 domain-containing protein YvlB